MENRQSLEFSDESLDAMMRKPTAVSSAFVLLFFGLRARWVQAARLYFMRISPSFFRVMDSGISWYQNPGSGKLSHLPIQPTSTSERNPFHADRPRPESSGNSGRGSRGSRSTALGKKATSGTRSGR